jgi:hypothetical protein
MSRLEIEKHDVTQNLANHQSLRYRQPRHIAGLAIALALLAGYAVGQAVAPSRERTTAVALGSQTAKNGFRNEDEIRDKFNHWRTDADARTWLTFMGYKPDDIEIVTARKPHGKKADVEVVVKTRGAIKTEGISIKLVSSPNGFNQIDKRWLATYAKLWKMPADVHSALRLFVGEDAPVKLTKDPKRMYLTELDPAARTAVIDFFRANKQTIVSDVLRGDGGHAAGWMMVAFKATPNTRWALKRMDDVERFFAEGPVEITRAGNLKIGRITMQRKGGDGGRDTAKQLQFKINPALLLTP